MSRLEGHSKQVIYKVRVRGVIDSRWSEWFDDMAVCAQADGASHLPGPVRDQAALHGLIGKIRDPGDFRWCPSNRSDRAASLIDQDIVAGLGA